jgi:hypothetical protein
VGGVIRDLMRFVLLSLLIIQMRRGTTFVLRCVAGYTLIGLVGKLAFM